VGLNLQVAHRITPIDFNNCIYRYENAIGVCENIGNRKSFLPKLEEAEHNKTMARLLFITHINVLICRKKTKTN